jgi:hypothetical protein
VQDPPPFHKVGSPYKVFPQEDCNGGPPLQNGATKRDKTASNAGLSSGGLSYVAGGGFRIIPAGPQLFLVSDVYFQGGTPDKLGELFSQSEPGRPDGPSDNPRIALALSEGAKPCPASCQLSVSSSFDYSGGRVLWPDPSPKPLRKARECAKTGKKTVTAG